MKNTTFLKSLLSRGVFAFTLLFLFHSFVFAENRDDGLLKRGKQINGVKAVRYVDDNALPQYIRFDQQTTIRPEEGTAWLQKHLDLPEGTGFELIRQDEDNLGYKHLRYQQTLHDIPLIGATYICHIIQGKVESMNGELFALPQERVSTPSIDANTALSLSMQYMPAELYAWESNSTEEESAPAYPEARLVYVPQHLDFTLPEFRLAYEVDLHASLPHARKRIYIDAETGMVIAEENRICHFDEVGTAETNFSGTVEVTTNNTGSGYTSEESGRNIVTLSHLGALFTDDDNSWLGTPGTPNEWAMDAHYGAEVYYDMLTEDYGRNSMDNQGHVLTSNIYYGQSYNNAFWNGSSATYGDGDGFQYTSFTSPEIVGHEFQHGTTEFSAGLIYSNESGALNESFSDIFGHMNDIRARSAGAASWIVGEQTTLDGEGIRSMEDPNIHGDPDTYGGDLWSSSNGVHTNSGVQNHWFQILSEGETGVNDLGDAYSVTGIGVADASQVAMRNLTYYLTPSSNYADAAFYARQAAVDVFGGCSELVAEVVNAWYAVGVGTEIPTEFTVDFAAVGNFCEAPTEVNFQNLTTLGDSYLWDFGDGITSTEGSPVHTYTSPGTYDVQLTAVSCTGETDVVTRNNFIIIDPEQPSCDTTIMPFSGSLVLNDCAGVILDPGGLSNYANNTSSTLTIDINSNVPLVLDFVEFSTESSFDFLFIYDGPDMTFPLIGSYSGSSLAGQSIETSSGQVTLFFDSDSSVTGQGFVINYSDVGNGSPAIADFSVSDANPPLNAPVIFSQEDNLGISTYNFGDGNFSTETNPTHSYSTPGTYTVQHIFSNCTNSDTATQQITVQDPGSFALNPDSLCVTLLSGETGQETVTFSNSGSGDLYYSFILPSGETLLEDSTVYITSGAATTLDFSYSGIAPYEIEVTVTVNGDYDQTFEYADVSIEGNFLDQIGENSEDNGTYISKTFVIDDPALITQFLSDQNVTIEVQNSPDVDTQVGGLDQHKVSIVFKEIAYLSTDDATTNIISPGTNHILTFDFNSAGLFGGVYTTNIPIQTGDPLFPLVNLPVKLTIIGTPLIELVPEVLDFGEVFIAYPETDSLCVNNPGNDTLHITALSIDNPLFSVNTSPFTVAPFSSVKLPVTFSPETTNLESGILSIENNVETVQVPLIGQGSEAPNASVNPDSVCVTLVAGDSTEQIINISNAGGGTLEWSLNSDLTNDDLEILAWIYGADLDDEWVNTQNALSEQLSDYNLSSTNTSSPTDFASALSGADILLIPEFESGDPAVISSMTPAIEDFLTQGGGLVFLGENFSPTVVQTLGLMPYTDTESIFNDDLFPLNPSHPVFEGVTLPILSPAATISCLFSDPEVQTILEGNSDGYSVLAEKPYGAGKIIYLGYDLHSYEDNDARLFANTITYLAGQLFPNWLSINPEAGSVAGMTSEEISLLINASDLETGTYEYDLNLSSNQPDNSELTIQVKLNVIDYPTAEFSVDDQTVCDGIVQFSNESENNPTSQTWDFGDGNTSEEESPSHTYTASGFYDVSLAVCNDLGCDTLVYENMVQVSLEDGALCDTLIMAQSGTEVYTDCSGIFSDPGGPFANYQNNINTTLVLAPEADVTVSVTFSEFNLESGWDYFRIYDGASTSAPLIGTYSGTSLANTTISSTGSALTINFTTDGSVTRPGFIFEYNTAGNGAPPTPGFALSGTDILLNSPLEVTSEASGAGSYLYDFGDGTTSSEENPIHYYTSPGTYTITQTVANCAQTDTFSQTVIVQEGGIFDISPDSLCVTLIQGQSSAETVSVINTGTSPLYFETEIPGPDLALSDSVIYTISGAQSLFSFSNLPSSFSTINITVTVNGDFDDTGEEAVVVLEGATIGTLGGLANGTDISQTWTFNTQEEISTLLSDGELTLVVQNDISVNTGQGGENSHKVFIDLLGENNLSISPSSGTVAPNSSTDFTVNLDATGLAGGEYTWDLPLITGDPDNLYFEYPVKLIVLALPEAAFSADDLIVCDGVVNFSDESTNSPTSWSWDFGDGTTSEEQNPQHIYSASGSYDVSLAVCTDIGCDTLTVENYISVDLSPGAICDTIIMQTTGTETLTACAGIIADPGGTTENYPNNVSSTIIINPEGSSFITLTFSEFETEAGWDELIVYDGEDNTAPLIGVYDGIAPEGESIQSTGGAMTLYFESDAVINRPGFVLDYQADGGSETPDAGFSLSDNMPPLNSPVQIINASTGAGNYTYDFGDGSVISGEATPSHSYTSPGTYTITQTLSNCSGSDMATQTVTVQEAGEWNYTPDSICVVLYSGDSTTETISLSNTGAGDLYYAFEAPNEDYSTADSTIFTLSGASSSFEFSDISSASALSITVTVNGDYDGTGEEATVFIEGTEVGILGDISYPNGTDISAVYDFTDPTEIQAFLADGILEVEILNSPSVDPITGGDDTHKVEIEASTPGQILFTPSSGNIPSGATSEVDVFIDSEGLLAGVYHYDIPVTTGDPDFFLTNYPIKLTVLATPLVNFSADTQVTCEGIIQFTDATLNSPETWLWDFGDGTSSTEQNPEHIYTTSGTYDVSLEACNSIGCSSFIAVDFIHVDLENAYCDTIVVDVNEEIELTSCSGIIVDNGDVTGDYSNNVYQTIVLIPDNAEQVSISFLEFETESCCDFLSVYDGDSPTGTPIGVYSGFNLPNGGEPITSTSGALTILFDTDSSVTDPGFIIQFDCVNTSPQSVFTANTSEDCSNTIEFVNSSLNADEFYWSFGDGTSSTEEEPVHTYLTEGNYLVTLQANNSQDSHQSFQSLDIAEMPFELSIDAPASLALNTPLTLSYSSSVNLTEVLWTLSNGTTSTADNPNVIFSEAGEVIVSLTGTDAEGCQHKVEHSINLLSDVSNSDLINTFEVYPNPSNGVIFVNAELANPAETELRIYNALGQLISTERHLRGTLHTYNLDMQDMPKGHYFMYLSVEGQKAAYEILLLE